MRTTTTTITLALTILSLVFSIVYGIPALKPTTNDHYDHYDHPPPTTTTIYDLDYPTILDILERSGPRGCAVVVARTEGRRWKHTDVWTACVALQQTDYKLYPTVLRLAKHCDHTHTESLKAVVTIFGGDSKGVGDDNDKDKMPRDWILTDAFYQAVSIGCTRNADFLLQQGADIDGKKRTVHEGGIRYDRWSQEDPAMWNPLLRSIDQGNLEMVRWLVERGVSVTGVQGSSTRRHNTLDNNGNGGDDDDVAALAADLPFDLPVAQNFDVVVVPPNQLALEDGDENVNQGQDDGVAVEEDEGVEDGVASEEDEDVAGDEEFNNEIEGEDDQWNMAEDCKETWIPLDRAAHHGYTGIVQYLLEQAPNADQLTTMIRSPTLRCAVAGTRETLKLLMDVSSTFAQPPSLLTVMQMTIVMDRVDMFRAIVPDRLDYQAWFVSVAVQASSLTIVRDLLENCPDIRHEALLAIDMARTAPMFCTVAVLLSSSEVKGKLLIAGSCYLDVLRLAFEPDLADSCLEEARSVIPRRLHRLRRLPTITSQADLNSVLANRMEMFAYMDVAETVSMIHYLLGRGLAHRTVEDWYQSKLQVAKQTIRGGSKSVDPQVLRELLVLLAVGVPLVQTDAAVLFSLSNEWMFRQWWRVLAERGVNVVDSRVSWLTMAVVQHKLFLVEFLVEEQGANVHEAGGQPLVYAAIGRNLAMCNYLLRKGASWDESMALARVMSSDLGPDQRQSIMDAIDAMRQVAVVV